MAPCFPMTKASLRQPVAVRSRRCRGSRWRRGTAAVETAVTLPLLILLVFGSMELANGIFLNQALSLAAYEGAREACRPGGTSVTASARVSEVLSARGIEEYELVIEPDVTEETPRATQVTATLTAPSRTFTTFTIGILGDRTSRQHVCMVKQ